MGFGLTITVGDALTPLKQVMPWLVEARVEMELSKPTRYALRFEEDICEGKPEVASNEAFVKNTKLGLFVRNADNVDECLVFGPVTKVRASSVLGGPGSWVEIHGEDRRVEMGRITVVSKHKGKASAVAAQILQAYGFDPKTDDTLIEHDDQTFQLTQSATDLAFLEDVARRNNLEFWLEYELKGPSKLIETANLRTSPERSQASKSLSVPKLVPEAGKVLRVNPPPGECANITRFDTRINFEKPASAQGFLMSDKDEKAVVAQLAPVPPPNDPEKIQPVPGIVRKLVETKVNHEETFLANEALVFEQSWFVEVDCSATLEQLDFVVRPHQIVEVANAGDALSGGYQVMKATHVVTSTDHLMDFTIRANGLGGAG